MTLRELITIAKFSELNTLRIAENDEVVVAFINLGLLELYGLFPLYTEEQILDLEDGKYIYDLNDDFMYMTGAYDVNDAGQVRMLPINEEANPLSVNTINFRQVQIPSVATGAEIGITYVPKPPKMSQDNQDVEVPLPAALLQPLLNFVAFKAHSGMRADQEGESNNYERRFLRSIESVRNRGIGIASDDMSMDTKLAQRGFV